MVQSRTSEVDFRERMKQINLHRKILHRSFTRFADKDTYHVLLLAHDAAGELMVVYALTAMPTLKEVLPYNLFVQEFEQQVEHKQPTREEALR